MNPVSAGPAAWEKLATGLEIDKLSIAPLSTLVKSPTFLPEGEAVCSRWHCLPVPSKRSLPQCFVNHHAAPSIRRLFAAWVERADDTDNGIIVINLRRQYYGHTTVAAAIKWLVKHKLMIKVERGGGRGVGSRYFIRWSFAHLDLSSRQKAVNNIKPANTVHPSSFRREAEKRISFCKQKTRKRVPSVERSPEKSIRWAMARIREALDGKCTSPQLEGRTQVSPAFAGSTDAAERSRAEKRRQRQLLKPYETAFAGIVWRVTANGSVRPGPELGAFVRGFVVEIIWNFRWETDPRSAFSFVEGLAVAEIDGIRVRRERETARRERETARREAEAHPVAELLQQEQVGSISDFVRKLVQKEV